MDYTKIIDSYRYKCKKLCFDTERIKNKEKIYLKYNILEGEKIIAFQKSKIPFLGLAIDGTIFTNNAVYMQPYNEKESVNKVLYKNICQYLIVQEHSKAEAVLCSRTKVLQLASSTLFGSNIAGEEMAEILKSIQIEQMRNDPDAVNYYDRVVEWVLDSARNCMKENELSESLVAKLEAIHNFNNYQERGLELQAENIYRSFELGKYENFISEKGIDDKKIHMRITF